MGPYQGYSNNPNLAAMGLAGMGMQNDQNMMENTYYNEQYEDIEGKNENKMK